MGIGVGGLGLGDWGLGIGPNPQSPIPNPQSPIPIFKYLISSLIKDNSINNHELKNKIKKIKIKYEYFIRSFNRHNSILYVDIPTWILQVFLWHANSVLFNFSNIFR